MWQQDQKQILSKTKADIFRITALIDNAMTDGLAALA